MSGWIYGALAMLVALTFVGMWWVDARRANKVQHDTERTRQVPPRRRWRRGN